MPWSGWYTPLPRSRGPNKTLFAGLSGHQYTELFEQDQEEELNAAISAAWGTVTSGGSLTPSPYAATAGILSSGGSVRRDSVFETYEEGNTTYNYWQGSASANKSFRAFSWAQTSDRPAVLDWRDYSETPIQDLSQPPYNKTLIRDVNYSAIPGAFDEFGNPKYVEYSPAPSQILPGGDASMEMTLGSGDSAYDFVHRTTSPSEGDIPAWTGGGTILQTITWSEDAAEFTKSNPGPWRVDELLVNNVINIAFASRELGGSAPPLEPGVPRSNGTRGEGDADFSLLIQLPDFRYWSLEEKDVSSVTLRKRQRDN